jgi:hypothetical protein
MPDAHPIGYNYVKLEKLNFESHGALLPTESARAIATKPPEATNDTF